MSFSFFVRRAVALASAVITVTTSAIAQTAFDTTTNSAETPKPASLPTPSQDATPTRDNIALVTAELLQGWQYTHHPFDAEMSGKFLDRYLDTLDYGHLFFLQSDLNEFDTYRTNLQSFFSISRHDVSPAYTIFNRFLKRAVEREIFETNYVQTAKFDFTGHDRFTADRHKLPNPTNLDQARALWRDEVRFDYLDEHLKAPDIAFGGPAKLDGATQVVISLPLKDTNLLSSTTPAPGSLETNTAKAVRPFLPDQLVDKAQHQIGWVTNDASNVIVHIQIPAGAALRKLTNDFYSPAGGHLGAISFLRETTTNVAARESSNVTYRGIVRLDLKDNDEIVKTLTRRYTGILKNMDDLTNDDGILEIYLTSLARAYDPHSDYMARSQSENFAIAMKLSLFGIGARLRSGEDGNCRIEDLVAEGPAAKSGQITNEDCIVAVAQKGQEPVEVKGMPLQKVVDMIRGPKGTEVTLTIAPAHPADPSIRQKTVTLIRDEIKLDDSAAKAELFETPAVGDTPARRVGVIDLPSFYGEDSHDSVIATDAPHTTAIDVARLIKRLKQEKVDGIVLDLRRNGGGFLEQAIYLTGLFVGKGPVVQTKSPDGITDTEDSKEKAVYTGPLVVLVSRYSASASEIFAGALQDYGRALIVGDKSTFGKGTVQQVVGLSQFMDQFHLKTDYDPGTLKVTIKKFYRAGGSSTQSNGVASDIVLPSVLNYSDVGESALPNPLPWDDVTSADPPDFNLVKPYLPELTKRSLQRREMDKDWTYIQQDIDEYRKALADKSLSMNEADRLAEQHEHEARAEARKKERLSRPKSNEKVYEITLKNADLPELEPKKVNTNSVSAAPVPDDDDPSLPTPDPAPSDPPLIEARKIVIDYAGLIKDALTADAAKHLTGNGQ